MRRRDPGRSHAVGATRRRRRGVAALEAAFVLPALLAMLLFLLELGRLFEARAVMINAAGAGARLASSGRVTEAEIQQSVRAALQRAGLDVTSLTVHVTVEEFHDPTGFAVIGTDPTVAAPAQDQIVRVVARIRIADLLLTNAFGQILTTSTDLSAEVVWAAAKDLP